MKTKIYVLSEPNGPIRYVGKTVGELKVRLQSHRAEARKGTKNHRYNWLRQINFSAEIDLVEEVTGNGSKEEIALISDLRNLGLSLVNGTNGGDGASPGFVPSLETRAKLSAAGMGHEVTPATRAKISAAHLGMKGPPVSDATRKKLSAARMGHVVSAQTRKKISMANNYTSRKEVKRIVMLRAKGWTHKQIAEEIGISQSSVFNKLHGFYLPGNLH